MVNDDLTTSQTLSLVFTLFVSLLLPMAFIFDKAPRPTALQPLLIAITCGNLAIILTTIQANYTKT